MINELQCMLWKVCLAIGGRAELGCRADRAEQSRALLQSRQSRVELYDGAEQTEQSRQNRAELCDVAGWAEQPYVMLQSRQRRAALCDVAEQTGQNSPM